MQNAMPSQKGLRPFLSALYRNKRGAVLPLFALSLIPMALAAGGAVDFTRYYDAQQTVQTALDAATLAGTAVYDGTNASKAENTADTTFSTWNIAVDGSIESPTFTPTSSSDALDLTGTTKVSFNMYFLGLVGINTLDFTVTSKAERTVTSTSSGNLCFLVKSTANSDTLTLNSGGVINAPECEVGVVSTHVSTATSGGTVVSSKFCVGGSMLFNTYPDNYQADCTPDADPYADADSIPIPTGDAQSVSSPIESTTTMQPGTYTSDVTFQNSITVTFAPGTYILKGSTFLFNSGVTVTGTGVTFYLADSGASIHFNSGSKATLTAPTSGTYDGILMFENPDITSTSSMTVDASGTLDGVVHLPTRNITFNGSSLTMGSSLIVVNTAILDSTVSVSGGTATSGTTYSDPRLVE